MPLITSRESYNGFNQRVQRLGLRPLLDEIETAVTDFPLLVKEARHANGTKWIRETIDARFEFVGGWTKVVSGGVDWTKVDSADRSIGVEVQVSGRSDLLAVDVLHLHEQLSGGHLDAGVIVVPDDTLSPFLTDRTPNLRTAIKHVDSRARDMPVQIIAFQHDGVGDAIPKARTNLGRLNP